MRSKFVAAFTLVAFAGVALLPPGVAWADEAADLALARQHFEAGRNAYLSGDYAGAINEFSLAQSLRASPILDYNIGMSYEAIGDGQNAYAAYQRYLTAKPDAQNRADVVQRMTALVERAQQQAAPAQQQAQAPAPPPAQPTPAAGAPAPTAQAQPAPVQVDPYGRAYAPGPALPAPVKKKGSNWWIVFPIVGGVALTVVLVWALTQNSGNCGFNGNCAYYDHALTTMPSAAFHF